jgi:hypothetical protein
MRPFLISVLMVSFFLQTKWCSKGNARDVIPRIPRTWFHAVAAGFFIIAISMLPMTTYQTIP